MAGKGSKSRISDRVLFRENYDKINWSKTKENTCKCKDICDNCTCNVDCEIECREKCSNKCNNKTKE